LQLALGAGAFAPGFCVAGGFVAVRAAVGVVTTGRGCSAADAEAEAAGEDEGVVGALGEAARAEGVGADAVTAGGGAGAASRMRAGTTITSSRPTTTSRDATREAAMTRPRERAETGCAETEDRSPTEGCETLEDW